MPPSETIWAAVRVCEGENHRDDENRMVSLVSSSPHRLFWFYCEEVLGTVDKREICYTTTRLRTPSTDQQSRRLSLIRQAHATPIVSECCPHTNSHFNTDPCAYLCHCKAPELKTIAISFPIKCTANDTHPLSSLEWCRNWWGWTATEWNQAVFNNKSRFNLGSNDNHVCVKALCWTSQSYLCFTAAHYTHSWGDGMECHCMRHTVTSIIY